MNIYLLQELDNYGRQNPASQSAVLPEARQVWAKLVNDSIAQSAVEYHELLQLEAAVRLHDLEGVLERMHDMDVARGQQLRTATHDLKGSVGILTGSPSCWQTKESTNRSATRCARF